MFLTSNHHPREGVLTKTLLADDRVAGMKIYVFEREMKRKKVVRQEYAELVFFGEPVTGAKEQLVVFNPVPVDLTPAEVTEVLATLRAARLASDKPHQPVDVIEFLRSLQELRGEPVL